MPKGRVMRHNSLVAPSCEVVTKYQVGLRTYIGKCSKQFIIPVVLVVEYD